MIPFNPRHLMEEAIKVMRMSIAERRTDGKTPPKVGTVLVDVGDDIPPQGERRSTAHRGELREGDHAEFTLLERKNRNRKLDSCVLFATLEPCAPNARKHPKLGCAERIVLARIKEVWVGIEDPDPTVDRKGIKYLQDHGVEVHMFDRDLQEIIRAENQDFIEQALERAAAVAETTPEIVLSPLEKPRDGVAFDDLSIEALESYRAVAKIPENIDSPAFGRRLVRLGLLQQENGRFVPTGFGFLLFGKEPRTAMPQAGLLGTIHYPNGAEETEDFDGPQVLVPERAIDWLRNKLPNLIDRSEAKRRRTNDPLFELVREGIVNALVHRDYSIEGAKCQFVISRDEIEIRSPGRPIEPITLEQMQSFGASMLSRNPVLHYVFAQMELAEERGLGLNSMKRRAEEAELPLPRYSWQDPYLMLTLYRNPEGVTQSLKPEMLAMMNEDERVAWQFLNGKDAASSAELMKQFDFDKRKAQRILNKLVRINLIRRVGKGPSTRYEVISATY